MISGGAHAPQLTSELSLHHWYKKPDQSNRRGFAMLDFYRSTGGRQFIDGTMKSIATSLGKLVKLLEDEAHKKDTPSDLSDKYPMFPNTVAQRMQDSFGSFISQTDTSSFYVRPPKEEWAVVDEGVLHLKDGIQFYHLKMHIIALRVIRDDRGIYVAYNGVYNNTVTGLHGLDEAPDEFETTVIPGHDGLWVIYATPFKE